MMNYRIAILSTLLLYIITVKTTAQWEERKIPGQYSGIVWASFSDVHTIQTARLMSTDGGLTWKQRQNLGIEAAGCICAPSRDTLYGCRGGGVYRSTDAGETWDSIYRQVDKDGVKLNSQIIGFWNSKSGIVCTGISTVGSYKCEYTHDAGETWNIVKGSLTGYGSWFYKISVVDSSSVYIFGRAFGTPAPTPLFGKIEAGGRESRYLGGFRPYLITAYYLYFYDTLNGVLIGSGGTSNLIYTTDGATTWIAVDYTFSESPSSACFVDSLQGYVGTEEGTIYRTMDGGQTWQEEFRRTSYIGEIFQMKYFPQERILYAVAERAILKRDVPSSVAGESKRPTLTLYPNPTTGTLYISGIDLFSSPSALVSITIRDVLGRTLMEASAHDHSTTLDISHIPVGQYIVQVGTGVVLLVKQ